MGKENKKRRTDGLDPWRTKCKPVPMQDTAARATQEGQDKAVKFHVEPKDKRLRTMSPDEAARHRQAMIDKGVIQPAGPGMTKTKVPGEGTPGMPGMTSTRLPND